MMTPIWVQKKIVLKPRRRGFHLVTQDILEQTPEIVHIKTGLAHIFIQHTSASLTLNENADPDVRRDLDVHLQKLIPDGASHYTHTLEGEDDMPAHIKASLLGNHLTLPIGMGRLLLGTWQGIYLGEHRHDSGSRSLIVTLTGESL